MFYDMRHINEKDRYLIEKLLKKKVPVKQIAEICGFSRQAIYAEIKKGLTLQRDTLWAERMVYLADAAERKHREAMEHTGRPDKLKPDDSYLLGIKGWVDKKYSPYAAMIRAGTGIVCEKTIYNYIHKGYIPGLNVYSLPYARPKKKRSEETRKRVFKQRGRSIDFRDPAVMQRDSFGHWEMDTVYSSKGTLPCLLVLTERQSRREICIKIKDRTAGSVLSAVNRLERKMGAPAFRDTFRTITVDNGSEFSDFNGLERSCINKGFRTELYFCHPYSSWERGSNENHNRFVRRFVPKGDDFSLYSDSEIQYIQDWINDYPRRMFGGLSSNEYLQVICDYAQKNPCYRF